MDPATLGTLIIGLDYIRRNDALDERNVARRERWRAPLSLARQRLADALRRTADRIAPAPSPA